MAKNSGQILVATLALFLASVSGMLLMAPGIVSWSGIPILALATMIQLLLVIRS